MGTLDDAARRRVFLPQALGADEFLRVTWHESRGVMVFSHWDGGRCVAATPVRVADVTELASLTAAALGLDPVVATGWPAPAPETLVVPAAGLTVPPVRLSA